MSRTNNLYDSVEDLVYDAIEMGANNTGDIFAYVTQYIPQSIVSRSLIENIMNEYSHGYDDNLVDNVY